MAEEKKSEDYDAHRKFAVDGFNGTWALLDKADRTPEDDDEMVHMAHASRWHWGKIGTPVEVQAGEWQISRVYAVLGRAPSALYHARRALDICRANNVGDFNLAYAYEANARAHAVAGDKAEAAKYAKLAREAGEKIAKDEDREWFFKDLATVPGVN